MPSGLQRFARQQLERLAPSVPEFPVAVVTAITTGGGTDGADLVTVNYKGASLKFSHLSNYTPAVNHVVILARSGGNWVILGRPIGFPPAS